MFFKYFSMLIVNWLTNGGLNEGFTQIPNYYN